MGGIILPDRGSPGDDELLTMRVLGDKPVVSLRGTLAARPEELGLLTHAVGQAGGCS